MNVYNLDKNVAFLGYIDDREKILSYFRKSDIFIFPSLSEGIPRVILEAMSQGVVCVSTPVGTLPYFFKHNETIRYADFNNSNTFYIQIKELIENQEIYKNIRNNALKKVLNNFTIDNFVKKNYLFKDLNNA